MTLEERIREAFGRDVRIEHSIYVSDYEHKKRSWKERLFSRPWQPLIKTKWVKSPKAYFIGDDRVVVSPETSSRLKEIV